jgi:hypothetical protein
VVVVDSASTSLPSSRLVTVGSVTSPKRSPLWTEQPWVSLPSPRLSMQHSAYVEPGSLCAQRLDRADTQDRAQTGAPTLTISRACAHQELPGRGIEGLVDQALDDLSVGPSTTRSATGCRTCSPDCSQPQTPDDPLRMDGVDRWAARSWHVHLVADSDDDGVAQRGAAIPAAQVRA